MSRSSPYERPLSTLVRTRSKSIVVSRPPLALRQTLSHGGSYSQSFLATDPVALTLGIHTESSNDAINRVINRRPALPIDKGRCARPSSCALRPEQPSLARVGRKREIAMDQFAFQPRTSNQEPREPARHEQFAKRTRRRRGGRNAQMILEIKLKSRIRRDAALDNVARFLKRTKKG